MKPDLPNNVVSFDYWFWLIVLLGCICIILVWWWPESKPKKQIIDDETQALSERLSKAVNAAPSTKETKESREERENAAVWMANSFFFNN